MGRVRKCRWSLWLERKAVLEMEWKKMRYLYGPGFTIPRLYIILGTLVVAFPLSIPKDVGILRYVSVLSVVSVIGITLTLIYKLPEYWSAVPGEVYFWLPPAAAGKLHPSTLRYPTLLLPCSRLPFGSPNY